MSLYNASPHSAIGHKTPFEVHFNRPPLTVLKPLLPDLSDSDSADSESTADSDLPDYSTAIRTEAKNSSERAAMLMVQHLPPDVFR